MKAFQSLASSPRSSISCPMFLSQARSLHTCPLPSISKGTRSMSSSSIDLDINRLHPWQDRSKLTTTFSQPSTMAKIASIATVKSFCLAGLSYQVIPSIMQKMYVVAGSCWMSVRNTLQRVSRSSCSRLLTCSLAMKFGQYMFGWD